ncbi:MAG: hypothetical protein KAH00_06295 [Cocleimonas sp.]|nr:hypothetical protein [Cocleimonas sp.]
MQLSNADSLRLNVLLAQPLKAIRINESSMTVHALTDKGEAKIALNPTVRDEQYLRWVRELLSLKTTGSPGGYPVYIKTWTRMGHADNTLKHMLLLGEPEAVIAVVYSPSVNHEIGVRAWWANPTLEVARRLMEYPDVIAGKLGLELAEFLMEFLPFEERQVDIVNMVRLCLQGTLISDKQKKALWTRAKRRNPYYVGFLHADPKKIPLELPPSKHYLVLKKQLQTLLDDHNRYAETLCKVLSEEGQKWLQTLKNAMNKPVDQDVVISLFTAIKTFFNLPFAERRGAHTIEIALQRAKHAITPSNEHPEALNTLLATLDTHYLEKFLALMLLAQLGENTLTPIFSGNESVGKVMRRRLHPLTEPLLEKTDILMS